MSARLIAAVKARLEHDDSLRRLGLRMRAETPTDVELKAALAEAEQESEAVLELVSAAEEALDETDNVGHVMPGIDAVDRLRAAIAKVREGGK